MFFVIFLIPIDDSNSTMNFLFGLFFASIMGDINERQLQILGMERLKSELQAHGLKCGGTLQERAARLLLLKSTPIDKLPKKLLAKPLK